MADDPLKYKKLKAVAKVPSTDTIVTPKGNVVTKQEWETAGKNGMPFESHEKYAQYVDGWAKPIKPLQAAKLKKVNQDHFDKSAGGMRYKQ